MDLASINELAAWMGSPVRGHGKNVMLCCPLAPVLHEQGIDRTPSFEVQVTEPPKRSLAHCFSCGARGYVIDVFTRAQDLVGGFESALELISKVDTEDFGDALSAACHTKDEAGQARRYGDYRKYVAECGRYVSKYLIDRGVVASDVTRWRLGWDEKLQRAVFPIWNEKKELVGATRRAVHPDQFPKYLDTSGLPKADIFYGEHLIDVTRGIAHVVEGPLDAVFASRVLPNVVATLGAGTGMSRVRVAKLSSWCKYVVLIPDGDEAGMSGTFGTADERGRVVCRGSLDTLRQVLPVSVALLPDGEDPASVSPGVLMSAVRNAQGAEFYKVGWRP